MYIQKAFYKLLETYPVLRIFFRPRPIQITYDNE